jgi:flagella basal body P-ring formation protein FlgA
MQPSLSAVLAMLFVVVACTAAAAKQLLMPVPLRTVLPGEPLQAGDFTLKLFEADDAILSSYVLDVAQLDKMAAARGLAANRPVALQALRTIYDVTKGKPTVAVYTTDAISIQGVLTPLVNAAAGQMIEARNAATGGRVKALVQSNGTLLVTGK